MILKMSAIITIIGLYFFMACQPTNKPVSMISQINEIAKDSLPPPTKPEKDWNFLDNLPIDSAIISDTLVRIVVEEMQLDSVLPDALIGKIRTAFSIWEYNQLSFHDFGKDGKKELLWVTANVPIGCQCYYMGTFHILQQHADSQWKIIYTAHDYKFVPKVKIIDNEFIYREGVYENHIYKLIEDSLFQLFELYNFNSYGQGSTSPYIDIKTTLEKLSGDTLIALYEYSIAPSVPTIENNLIMSQHDSKEDQEMLQLILSSNIDLISKKARVKYRLYPHQKRFIPIQRSETTLLQDSMPYFSIKFFLETFKKELAEVAQKGSPEQKAALKFIKQKKELREETLKNGDQKTTYLVNGKIIFQALTRNEKLLWSKQFNHKTGTYEWKKE